MAVADLSPKLRKLFKNLVLGALFVGSGYPDFDIVFEHIKRELSATEKIIFNGEDLLVTFEPILLVADLIAKSENEAVQWFLWMYALKSMWNSCSGFPSISSR